MPTRKSPRKGSLQFWPRKRASKFLPRVNWNAINSGKNLKGFICYKAGMVSVIVKDNTPNSMTKGKNIAVPATILECPPMKILSVRFYKNKKVIGEVLADNLEKEIKKKIKIPKNKKKKIEDFSDYDDVKIICYSIVKKTGIKKNPDISEIGLAGNLDEKIKLVKENLGKEISALNVFEKGQLVDLRGLTKGKGLQGPVKRFGITLKSHKSEKGVRKPGSIGPWHPARVTFRVPMAGQMGMQTRAVYNSKIIDIGKSEEKFKSIIHFGDIKTDYVIISGSVQGPAKRQLIITAPLRETKEQKKKNFELVEVLR
ncbi:MAG: 50S ribosomal protein L3 [archaeon]